jgi:geranylgeranyl diphosphate synthase type I
VTTYDAYGPAVQGELKELLASRNGFLYDLLRYHLGWTDQYGQPEDNPVPPHFPSMLALAVCKALSADYAPALPVAAAVELVCHFTAVHGDVQAGRMDDQDRPSIWWVWGPAQAINAGDGLHALARSVLMRLSDAGVAAETVLAALSALDRACLTLCEGQYMDLTYQDQLMVSEADYMDMIDRKSGALAGCSARLGALSCGAQPATADALEQWGTKLGMARQVRDDIYDLWGRSGDGFTPANILNKKKSLPLIHALHHTDTAAKRELGGIYMKRVLEPGDAPRIVSILDEAGSREYSNEKIDQLLRQAREAVTGANVTLEQPELLDWATKLIVDRDS